MLLPIIDTLLFHNPQEQDGSTAMHLIEITVLIVTDDHVCKTVMNPSSGTWMKNRDDISAWIKESVGRLESVKNTHSSIYGN